MKNKEYKSVLRDNNLWTTPNVRVQIMYFLMRERERAWEKLSIKEIAKPLWQLPHQALYLGLDGKALCLEIQVLWAGVQ